MGGPARAGRKGLLPVGRQRGLPGAEQDVQGGPGCLQVQSRLQEADDHTFQGQFNHCW
ncbi:UNVERIFIED_CONTAM: hypothetical protein GTU68_053676 [Idotea baltica]|nr:hypothetical protein [Idotea baltica]